MFPTFAAEIKSNKVVIPEFDGNDQLLNGKNITVLSVESKLKPIFEGIYEAGQNFVESAGKVLVILHHKIELSQSDSIFDEKYQLGTRTGEVDN